MSAPDPNCSNCHGSGQDPRAVALEKLGAVLPLDCACKHREIEELPPPTHVIVHHDGNPEYALAIGPRRGERIYFRIYEICGWGTEWDGTTELNEYWMPLKGDHGGANTHDYREATVFIGGSVKRDGCCDWELDNDTTMVHVHSAADMQVLGTALARVYDLCKDGFGEDWYGE